MPILGNFAATFANGTTMDAAEMNEVFLNSNQDGIYDVIHTLEARGVNKVNFDANMGISEFMPERLFQFLPFPGAGGHTHDLQSGDPLGARIAADAIKTEMILRDQCTLIFTGAPKVFFNKGTTNVTVAVRNDGSAAGNWGHTDVDVTTDGDFTANLYTFAANQIPVFVASSRNDGQATCIYVESITAPNRWRINVSLRGTDTIPVDWFVIGVRA